MKYFSRFPTVPAPAPSFSHFISQLPDHAGVLELGCKDGVSALQAMRMRPDLRWIGIDSSTEQVKIAQDMALQYSGAGFKSPVFEYGELEHVGELPSIADAPFDAAVVRLPANLFRNIVGIISLVIQVSDLLLPDGLAYFPLPGVFDPPEAMQGFLEQVFDSAIFSVVNYFPGVAYILRKQ